jgi:lactate dehydrogenase-like 2-hydroxyacid dehydrogenase
MPISSRPRVALTRPDLPGAAVTRLAEHYELAIWDSATPPGPAGLAGLVRDCDAALVVGTDRIDPALLDAGSRLRVVALASMGYDSVDVAAATERGVVVTHTPNVLADTTADLALALMLMARRRLVRTLDALRRGEWTTFRMDAFLGLDVYGATLGVVGFGQIGQALARRAGGLGMRVQHHDRSRRHDLAGSRAVGLDELLRTSDVVSLHVPLTPATRGLIGAAELATMKPTATLVNTSRGGIVDEAALLDALRAGRLHSAGLDVMVGEPRSDPADPLLHEPNLVVLPHVGSATEATRAAMVDLAAENILAVLAGADAPTPVPGTPARGRAGAGGGPQPAS